MSTVGYEKLIAARYDNFEAPLYHFSLKLKITNAAGNLNKVLQLLSRYNLNIKHISFLETNYEFSVGSITIELANPSKINFIVKDLERHSQFVYIQEKKFV